MPAGIAAFPCRPIPPDAMQIISISYVYFCYLLILASEANGYDPTVITEPKTFHIHKISISFDLMVPCYSRR